MAAFRLRFGALFSIRDDSSIDFSDSEKATRRIIKEFIHKLNELGSDEIYVSEGFGDYNPFGDVSAMFRAEDPDAYADDMDIEWEPPS